MSKIVFENNFATVKAALKDEAVAALYEIGAEIKSQAKRNTRVATSATKNSFDAVVDDASSEIKLSIGSPKENAIWEEYGTGEYAVNGDGRKGYWVYVKNSDQEDDTNKKSSKEYTLEEAKRVVAILRKKGLEAYYTKGKKPTKALTKAFEKKKEWAQKHLAEKLGEISGDN